MASGQAIDRGRAAPAEIEPDGMIVEAVLAQPQHKCSRELGPTQSGPTSTLAQMPETVPHGGL